MSRRQQRIDSTDAAVAIMSAIDIVPPEGVPLNVDETDFFSSIIAEAPNADWTAHQI